MATTLALLDQSGYICIDKLLLKMCASFHIVSWNCFYDVNLFIDEIHKDSFSLACSTGWWT